MTPDPELAIAVAALDDRQESRALYHPTRSETVNACETLLRAGLNRDARGVVRQILEEAAHAGAP